MAKLDRLVWVETAYLSIYGLRVGIRSNSADVIEQLMSNFPLECRRLNASDVQRLYSFVIPPIPQRHNLRPFCFLYRDAYRVGRAPNLQQLAQSFETDLALHVAECAPHYLFVHAGVVSWKGQGILFPGYSFSGKSHLVREFLRAGADYYSDEFAILTRESAVRPYARCLYLREKDRPVSLRLTAEELGARTGKNPLPVRLIVLTSFRRGAQWRPQRLSRGMGMLRMLEHTVGARTKPKLAFSILGRVVDRAEIITSMRGEAAKTLPFIVKHLEC
jgi:hypothetical protein